MQTGQTLGERVKMLEAGGKVKDDEITRLHEEVAGLRRTLQSLIYAAQGGNAEIGNVEAFRWLADRMVYIYGESPNVDFVRALRTRAAMLEVPLEEARAALSQSSPSKTP